MTTNTDKLPPLTHEQITASRDRLTSEGFTSASKAIRVHDQLLALTAAHEVNTNGAVQSIEELQAECERLRVSLDTARAYAIMQDCGRLCDANPKLDYREQLERSGKVVDAAIRQALAESTTVDDRPDANLSVRKSWGGV